MKIYLGILLVLAVAGCGSKRNKAAGAKEIRDSIAGPYSYDLNAPEKYYMPDQLHEISGIAFSQGNPDTLYAEQDEQGRLFHFRPGSKTMGVCKFAKKGDYEDVAICNGLVIILRSDGVLFSFPLNEANQEVAVNVQQWESLLPDGEFEGMWADEKTGKLYVLCKHCNDDKTSKSVSGTILQIDAAGKITTAGNFSVNVKEIERLAGSGKVTFHPSALAKNPLTGEWFIVSAVNKMLVVTDDGLKPKAVYALNTGIFNQPEGIAFDRNGNLYISNEGGEAGTGTVLKFAYRRK